MPADSQGPQAPQQHRLGEHWSTANPIPRIQKFMETLDAEKKERNRMLDEQKKKRKEQGLPENEEEKPGHYEQKDGTTVPHRQREVSKRKTRVVTDPTTGREIEVEDQDEESMDAIRDPSVFFTVRRQRTSANRVIVDHSSECQHWERNGESWYSAMACSAANSQ